VGNELWVWFTFVRIFCGFVKFGDVSLFWDLIAAVG